MRLHAPPARADGARPAPSYVPPPSGEAASPARRLEELVRAARQLEPDVFAGGADTPRRSPRAAQHALIPPPCRQEPHTPLRRAFPDVWARVLTTYSLQHPELKQYVQRRCALDSSSYYQYAYSFRRNVFIRWLPKDAAWQAGLIGEGGCRTILGRVFYGPESCPRPPAAHGTAGSHPAFSRPHTLS